MCQIPSFVLPKSILPDQYLFRATEAKKILSVTELTPEEMASRIALAELGQIILFLAQAILFACAYSGVITPFAAGALSAVLIPIEALCSYQTFVHNKPFSRVFLTAASVFTLTLCASLALYGIVKDSAITLCAGGVVLHVFRNLSEFIDARNSKNNPLYRQHVLNEIPIN